MSVSPSPSLKSRQQEVLAGSAWLLLPLAALPSIIQHMVGGDFMHLAKPVSAYVVWGMVALWVLGCILLAVTKRIGRVLVSFAILSTLSIGGDTLTRDPVLTLAVAVLTILILSRLWLFADMHFLSAHYVRLSVNDRIARGSRLATVGASIVAGLNFYLNVSDEHHLHVAAFISASFALLALFRAVFRLQWRYRWRGAAVLFSALLMVPMYLDGFLEPRWVVLWTLFPTWVGFFLLPKSLSYDGEQVDWWEPISSDPARLFAASFLGLALFSSFLLSLPIAGANGVRIPVIDSMFTAISAVCVTGLATIDPAADLSRFGRVVLIASVQVGGLGVMTFSLAVYGVLRRRLGLRLETALSGMIRSFEQLRIVDAFKIIVLYMVGVEMLGALGYAWSFHAAGMDWNEAVAEGIFTAISAFNNAGFTLTGASLIPYAHNPSVLLITTAMTILGGFSPFLWIALLAWRETGRLDIVHRLSLGASVVLLVVGAVGFLAIEWEYTMRELPWGLKVLNAIQQSASARTAGLTALDLTQAHSATVMMLLVLMLIGGNPGSVAGGVKTTTVAILVLAVVAAIRGQSKVQVGNRFLSHSSVYRAAATAFVMLSAVFGFSMLLVLTQALPARDLIFEVVSALTTTGHSLDTTVRLDEIGKVLMMFCMFIGRVGMLTLFMFLATREIDTPWQMAEEDVDVG